MNRLRWGLLVLLLLAGLLAGIGSSPSQSSAAACRGERPATFDITLASTPSPFAADVGEPFTVTVTAKDACIPSRTVTGYKGPATLSASGGGITAISNLTFTRGRATASLTATTDASGVTLTVTDNADSSITGTSAPPFEIYDELIPCNADGCSGSVDSLGTGTFVTANISGNPSLSGNLGLSLSGHNETIQCFLEGSTEPTSAMTIGSLHTIAPPPDAGTFTEKVRYSKQEAPGTGVANFVHCMNTGPDGSFEQVLLCDNQTPSPKCILDQRRNGIGELVVTFLLNGVDPVGGGFG